MPLSPTNISEERDMALANSLYRLTSIVKDMLETQPEPKLTVDFKRQIKHRQDLSKIDDALQCFFFGD